MASECIVQDLTVERKFFQRISCCVITGASRGLGRSIANGFALKFPPQSVFILLSRDINSLENVRSEILSKNPDKKVIVKNFDQGVLEQHAFDSLFLDIFQENNISASDFQQAVMIHNCGTIGDISKYVRDLCSTETVQANFDINVSGMILLNSVFLQTFKKDLVKHRTIVNIASLAAIKPFKSWSLYCAGKAARNMFFQVLAVEEPDIRVLNYGPGPCQTDMQRRCREESADPEVKQMFMTAYENGQILDCDTSVMKLFQILEKDHFETGAHVDYYDPL